MGSTIIDWTLAARIAQEADADIAAIGSVVIDNTQVLAVSDDVAKAIDKAAYSELGLDLGPSEVVEIQGKSLQVWKGAPTAFAA